MYVLPDLEDLYRCCASIKIELARQSGTPLYLYQRNTLKTLSGFLGPLLTKMVWSLSLMIKVSLKL